MPDGPAPVEPARFSRALLALIAGQIGMHAAMAGLRMAAPLDALREGASAFSVGLLLALFAAAPVVLALATGRMADRLGYHRPLRLAIVIAVLSLALALASTWAPAPWRFVLLCLGATGAGAGVNIGLIVAQRTGTVMARSSVERMRLFSWLGVAPALSNVLGPVAAGLLIDTGGFRAAYLFLLVTPLIGLWTARSVPRSRAAVRPPIAGGAAWDLLRAPGMKRLLGVNWLLAACWDVHIFAVPILGHARGFSATTIGLVLGSFTLAVTLIRLVIPLVAHRLREVPTLRAAMLGTALVFALYPLAPTPLWMAACASALGVALGAVQPMIMSMLHRLTPDDRHGESLALRSMAINASSTAMPLLFGAVGAALGAGALFWLVGGAVGSGAWLTRRLEAAAPRDDGGSG